MIIFLAILSVAIICIVLMTCVTWRRKSSSSNAITPSDHDEDWIPHPSYNESVQRLSNQVQDFYLSQVVLNSDSAHHN